MNANLQIKTDQYKSTKNKFVDSHKSSVNSHRERGFSLIELLIVISIFSVLATYGIFSMFSFYQRKNLDNDAQKIAFTVRAAKDKSITQEDSSQWGVHFENPATSTDFYILFKGSVYSSSTAVLRKNLNAGNKFLSPASGTSKDVIFSKMEGLPAATTSIIISLVNNDTVFKTISVIERGEVQY